MCVCVCSLLPIVIPVNYVVNKQTKDNNGPYTDPCQAGSSLLQSLDPIDSKNKLIAPQGFYNAFNIVWCVCVCAYEKLPSHCNPIGLAVSY